ncbi:hypothetical protein [Streptomyces sp. NPDC102462]
MDARARAGLTGRGADVQTVRALLGGQSVRGVSDSELSALTLRTGS